MNHFTRRALIALAALAAAAALAASPARAAAPPGTVTANDAEGVTYAASDDGSKITITQAGYPVVDDTVPLKAGAGCALMPADPTQAWCIITAVKRVTVSAAGGDDTVTNLTGLQLAADGGSGDDTLYGGTAADALKGGAGDDQLRGDGGNDTLLGGAESDSLDGSGGADSLFGGSGHDALRGGTGHSDYLDGGTGDDTLNGGDGEHDRVTYETRTADVRVRLAQPNDGMSSGNGEQGENDEITQVEDVRGSAGADYVMGNERDNWLESHAGSKSVMFGLEGADVLIGSDGSDWLAGFGWYGYIHDGARDTLFARGGDDDCGYSTIDPDFTDQCE